MLAKIVNSLETSGPFLISVLVKSSALLLLSLVATQLLRRRSASLRHFVHSLAILGVLILPFAAWMLPELKLAVLPPQAVSQITPRVETEQDAFLQGNRPTEASPATSSVANPFPPSDTARPSSTPSTPESRAAESAAANAFDLLARVSLDWRKLALLAWLPGMLVFLIRFVIIRVRLHALLRRAQPVKSIHLSSRLRWLCRDMGIKREIALLASDDLEVPIAAGVFNPRIVLSPQSADWNDLRREAVLSHELAHIKRLDGFTQMLAEIALAIHWFNPLVWLTTRAMRFERERACDDYVLSFGAAASDYAHELIEIVSTLRRPQPAAALAMARRSQLEGRVLALLDARVPHRAMSRGIAALASIGLAAVTLPLGAATLSQRATEFPAVAGGAVAAGTVARSAAVPYDELKTGETMMAQADEPKSPATPALPAEAALPPAPPEPPTPDPNARNSVYTTVENGKDVTPFGCLSGHDVSSSIHGQSDDNGYRNWTASWTGGDCSIDARMSGMVRFNADATAIESISSGGYFEVNERKGDTLRRLRVEPGNGAQLTYTYKLNGTPHDFDSDARAWFSNFLLGMERTTGFSADTRVPALLAKGGPQAVLDEINHLESDYVRQIYFTRLFENATLPGPMLVRALDQARSEISTDYSLAQVLMTIAQRYDLNDESQRTAFLNAANNLHTDYEHSRVLLELLKRPNLSPQLLHAALQSAKTINTDYDKGRILTTLAGLSTFDEKEISDYLDLAGAIGTDYERSRALMALMDHQKLSPASVSKVLSTASGIGTDYQKSRILLEVSQSHNFDENQIGTYLNLVDSIGTDYERSRDLIALMQQHKLANDSVGRIIAETSKIGTDYEKARVLTEAAGRYDMSGPLRAAYIKAADSIGTEYDRTRTLAAIAKRQMM